MRPGTGDSFLKLIFFAGMWAIAVNVFMFGLAGIILMISGTGGQSLLVFLAFGYGAALGGAPIIAARVHETDKIIAPIFSLAMITGFGLVVVVG